MVWFRKGDPDDYSEFTFCPADPEADPSPQYGMRECIPQMKGGRDTGVATGQYAFCEPGEDRNVIREPEDPLILTEREEPHDLQHAAISMMRFAECAPVGYAGMTFQEVVDTLDAFVHLLPIYRDEKEAVVRKAIYDWKKHKKVHPMNILLGRLGYDGIEYVGDAEWACKSGTFGNVKFPLMDEEGDLVCMEHSGSIYMRPDEECLAETDRRLAWEPEEPEEPPELDMTASEVAREMGLDKFAFLLEEGEGEE